MRRERTRAGGGSRGGQWHICPQTGMMCVCLRGRREAAHAGDSPPAQRPSCAYQSCLGISGNLAWPMPSASYTHATPAMCHKISFTKAVDLTLPPTNSSVGSAAHKIHTQDVIHTTQINVLYIYFLESAPMHCFLFYFIHIYMDRQKSARFPCLCFILGVQRI